MVMSTLMALGDILLDRGYRVIFDGATENYTYIGIALPKTKLTEDKWSILRIEISGGGTVTDYCWCEGEVSNFNKSWTNRKNGTYTYNFD